MTHIKDQDPSEIREKANFLNSEQFKSRTSWEWYSLQELKIRFNLTFDDSEIRFGGERSEIKKSNLYLKLFSEGMVRCRLVSEAIKIGKAATKFELSRCLDFVDFLHEEGAHRLGHRLDDLVCEWASLKGVAA